MFASYRLMRELKELTFGFISVYFRDIIAGISILKIQIVALYLFLQWPHVTPGGSLEWVTSTSYNDGTWCKMYIRRYHQLWQDVATRLLFFVPPEWTRSCSVAASKGKWAERASWQLVVTSSVHKMKYLGALVAVLAAVILCTVAFNKQVSEIQFKFNHISIFFSHLAIKLVFHLYIYYTVQPFRGSSLE